MTKEEFIHYTRGIIDSEIEKARIETLGLPQPSEGQLIGPLKLIKDALDKVNMTESKLYPDTRIPGYQGPILTNPCISSELPDEVPYGSICSCNPANGGSGICGCIMGNRMVPNPKKYPGSLTTTSTDKINITTSGPYSTNITATN